MVRTARLFPLLLAVLALVVLPAPVLHADGDDDGDGGDALPAAADDAGMHAPLDRLLRATVNGRTVNYRKLKQHEAVLDGYLATLRATEPDDIENRAERLAFWINAYNAFTLKLILNHYPGVTSILKLDDGKTWKVKRWNVGGERYSLDQIEHEVIRKTFNEPRIHFAVNCASKGCPDLRAEAFVGARLNDQLEEQTRRFLADTGKGVKWEVTDGKLHLHVSKIFEWFADDFKKAAGSVVNFIARHARGTLKAKLDQFGAGDTKLHYTEYDWSLNGR